MRENCQEREQNALVWSSDHLSKVMLNVWAGRNSGTSFPNDFLPSSQDGWHGNAKAFSQVSVLGSVWTWLDLFGFQEVMKQNAAVLIVLSQHSCLHDLFSLRTRNQTLAAICGAGGVNHMQKKPLWSVSGVQWLLYPLISVDGSWVSECRYPWFPFQPLLLLVLYLQINRRETVTCPFHCLDTWLRMVWCVSFKGGLWKHSQNRQSVCKGQN